MRRFAYTRRAMSDRSMVHFCLWPMPWP